MSASEGPSLDIDPERLRLILPRVSRLRQLLLTDIVPFWERYAVDGEYGGFFSCLDRDGSRYGDDKYTWMLGRGVWMFATLQRLVAPNEGWLTHARQAMQFLERFARAPDGRFYFALSRQGRPLELQRKIYSGVFYQLGCSALYRITGEARLRDQANSVFDWAVDGMRQPQTLGRLPLPGQPAMTSLADPMVILNMIDELRGAGLARAEHDALADEMIAVAQRHVDASRRRVFEFALPDGSRPDGPKGRLQSPGHSIELSWFLLHEALARGLREQAALAIEILDWSLDYGWDQAYGGLYYFLDAEGRPPLQLEWSMKLWWPHTEALYATLLAWVLTGQERYLTWYDRLVDYCLQHFADPEYGEWFVYLDRAGKPTHLLKAGPYKGFFHLPRALLYCSTIAERLGAGTTQQ